MSSIASSKHIGGRKHKRNQHTKKSKKGGRQTQKRHRRQQHKRHEKKGGFDQQDQHNQHEQHEQHNQHEQHEQHEEHNQHEGGMQQPVLSVGGQGDETLQKMVNMFKGGEAEQKIAQEALSTVVGGNPSLLDKLKQQLN